MTATEADETSSATAKPARTEGRIRRVILKVASEPILKKEPEKETLEVSSTQFCSETTRQGEPRSPYKIRIKPSRSLIQSTTSIPKPANIPVDPSPVTAATTLPVTRSSKRPRPENPQKSIYVYESDDDTDYRPPARKKVRRNGSLASAVGVGPSSAERGSELNLRSSGQSQSIGPNGEGQTFRTGIPVLSPALGIPFGPPMGHGVPPPPVPRNRMGPLAILNVLPRPRPRTPPPGGFA